MNAPLPARVVDPVCGRELSTEGQRLPRNLYYRGRRYFFCDGGAGQDCRLVFKRDPARWADASASAGVPVGAGVARPSRPPSPFKVRTTQPGQPDDA